MLAFQMLASLGAGLGCADMAEDRREHCQQIGGDGGPGHGRSVNPAFIWWYRPIPASTLNARRGSVFLLSVRAHDQVMQHP